MPTIELITRRPAGGPARPRPLLFVHGAFCGGWIWDEHFLPWFAERGWTAHALSLRGHGKSGGRDALIGYGLSDYVNDVLSVYDGLDTPPVLIGHSMGGMVVQRVLARRPATPAAVLMSSSPPTGLLESSLWLAWCHPIIFQQMALMNTLGENAVDPATISRAMFSDAMPRDEAVRYMTMMQGESKRILMEIGGWIPFPVLPPRTIPILVMGAENDRLIPPSQVRATARLLNTEAEILPGLGHGLMLEPAWETVARRIDAWLAGTLGGAERAAA
ncbi:pimeloyl-ACP methyl ester carboxylesterase [Azospirillum fermentarium]|uniref:alpha/beta hydrolase n=1 Tax=Azospirillum fermentarium TaxID=1233114 RepID=UPI00222734C3|nr:alpha/beta hydrolase [Azospirillum fermentarium]MCW2246335.1 pimeloyl-ACP methyl ester carboxylesterase [Azospirillum fermentarium]